MKKIFVVTFSAGFILWDNAFRQQHHLNRFTCPPLAERLLDG